MNVVYKSTNEIPCKELDNLIENVGWGRRGEDVWKKTLIKSSFTVSAWSNDKLIGLGRVVEDGVMCMIYDVAVHSDYQNQGIGSNIMNMIVKEIKNNNFQSVGLFAWRENPMNIDFYSKFGFEQVNFGMKFNF